MVVKKRSNSSDRMVLPVIQVYNDHEHKKSILISARQDHVYGEGFPSAILRRWGSTSLHSHISKSKKHDTLPSWGNPQDGWYECPLPESQIATPTKHKKVNLFNLVTFLFVLLGGVLCRHLKSKLRSTLAEIKAVLVQRNDLKIKLRAGDKDIRILSREIATVRHRLQIDQYSGRTDRSTKRSPDSSSLKGMKNQVNSYKQQSLQLKERIQYTSRGIVEKMYGIGNDIHVEFVLDFPDGKLGPNTFTVQMASLDTMPTAVFTFLSMIEQGLWDGTSIIMPANHIMTAVPLSFDETKDSGTIVRSFLDANLNGPVFKEYNDEFLKAPYTLAFAGRGSPNFYISAEKNADLHPSDAAFGKVNAGFDTLARIESIPVVAGNELRNRVGIKSTKILVLSNRSLRSQR